jgi:fucose permease
MVLLLLCYGRSTSLPFYLSPVALADFTQIAMAAIELATSSTAFWTATGAVFRLNNPRTTHTKDNRMVEALLRAPNARVTWVCALFLLGYVGVEVALGGWIVKFMLEVRKGGEFASGMTATGFWMGITVGRIVLGFVTPKLGEKLAIAVSPLFARPPNSYPPYRD